MDFHDPYLLLLNRCPNDRVHLTKRVSNDGFGYGGYALSDRYFVVGAPYRDTEFIDDEAGAVYIFDREIITVSTGLRTEQTKPKINNDLYPNPFSVELTVAITLESSSNVRLLVYNTLGQEVSTLFRGVLPGGSHRYNWRPGIESAGVYFLKLEIGNQVHFQQVVYNP